MSAVILTVVFLILYFGSAVFLLRGLRMGTRELCICGVMIALTLVLDSIRIPLPTGATLSLCSPVPLLLLALLWDGRLAILSGWVCGILAIFLIPVWQPVHWGQIFVEHLVCFSCLGYAGLLGGAGRWKRLRGLIAAFALNLAGHILSGVIFFAENAWDGWGAWGYSLAYNLAQNVPLALLCIAVVMVLPLPTLARTIKGEEVPHDHGGSAAG